MIDKEKTLKAYRWGMALSSRPETPSSMDQIRQVNILLAEVFKNRIQKIAALQYFLERPFHSTTELDKGEASFMIEQLVMHNREKTVKLLEYCLEKGSPANAYAHYFINRSKTWKKGKKGARTRMLNRLEEMAQEEGTTAKKVLEKINGP